MTKKTDLERGACEKGDVGVHMVKPNVLHGFLGLELPKMMLNNGKKLSAGNGACHSIAFLIDFDHNTL